MQLMQLQKRIWPASAPVPAPALRMNWESPSHIRTLDGLVARVCTSYLARFRISCHMNMFAGGCGQQRGVSENC